MNKRTLVLFCILIKNKSCFLETKNVRGTGSCWVPLNSQRSRTDEPLPTSGLHYSVSSSSTPPSINSVSSFNPRLSISKAETHCKHFVHPFVRGNTIPATLTTSGGGSIGGARAPPLREIFTWIYLPTINKLLSLRNQSKKLHSVCPRLIVWHACHCQQPFKCIWTSMIWARLVIGHSK